MFPPCGRLLLATLVAGLAVAAGCSSIDEADEGAGDDDLTVSKNLVIAQVFGGGGNIGAPFRHDYVELFNRGKGSVSLAGKSLQYASSAQAFDAADNVVDLPDVVVAPGTSFLIQLGSGGANGVALPDADLVVDGSDGGSTAFGLAKDKGKLALVRTVALLDGCGAVASPCPAAGYVDLVGYGSASQAEGTPASAFSNTKAGFRKNGGCQDTGDNAADFVLGQPAPRSSAAPAAPCSSNDGGATDAATDAAPSDAASTDTGASTDASLANDSAVDGASTEPVTPPADEPDELEAPSEPDADAGPTTDAADERRAPRNTSWGRPVVRDQPRTSDCAASPAGREGSSGLALVVLAAALTALARRRRSLRP